MYRRTARLVLCLPLALAACAAPSANRPAPRIAANPARLPPLPVTAVRAGLDTVMGQTARNLTGLFGTPDVDMVEGSARKLQFGSAICVLDAYLYPPQNGRGDAVVTHIDTRQRDGSAIDQASCVAALTRKGGGK